MSEAEAPRDPNVASGDAAAYGAEAPSGRPAPPARQLKEVQAFNYVTVPNAPTYRAIVQVFHEAKERYVIEVRPVEVLELLRAARYHVVVESEADLERHLGRLVEWGNLLPTHDAGSITTLADFYRSRLIYHLTPVGEAAHRAVLEVEATLGKTGSLQTTMLAKIRDTLRELAEAWCPGTATPALLVRLLHDLHAAFETLTEEAQRFMGSLNRFREDERLVEERFVMRKQAVLAYVSRFIAELRARAAEIAAEIDALELAGVDAMLALATRSADLPPALGDEDPAESWRREQRGKWTGVRTWFLRDAAGGAPTVDRLAEVAVEAVVDLTRALGRLNDRRSRRVDRGADFRTLARWFAACDDDNEAHRLWRSALGVHSARHFHFEEQDHTTSGPAPSWWEAPPIEVPIRLHTHGNMPTAGKPSPAADHSATRQWIEQRRKRERAQLEEAMRRFAGRGELRVSDIATLDEAEFDLLLALLDEALTAPRRADGSRVTRTADGRLTVTLNPPPPDEDRAELRTPRGTLLCSNYRLTVSDAHETDASTAGATGAAAEGPL